MLSGEFNKEAGYGRSTNTKPSLVDAFNRSASADQGAFFSFDNSATNTVSKAPGSDNKTIFNKIGVQVKKMGATAITRNAGDGQKIAGMKADQAKQVAIAETAQKDLQNTVRETMEATASEDQQSVVKDMTSVSGGGGLLEIGVVALAEASLGIGAFTAAADAVRILMNKAGQSKNLKVQNAIAEQTAKAFQPQRDINGNYVAEAKQSVSEPSVASTDMNLENLTADDIPKVFTDQKEVTDARNDLATLGQNETEVSIKDEHEYDELDALVLEKAQNDKRGQEILQQNDNIEVQQTADEILCGVCLDIQGIELNSAPSIAPEEQQILAEDQRARRKAEQEAIFLGKVDLEPSEAFKQGLPSMMA